jgi:methylthioribose-1-phosphate isomerase
MIPTIEWQGQNIRMIDQRKIPGKIEWYICRGYKDVISAIQKMVIRGAPAIGVAAAMGLAKGAESIQTKSIDQFKNRFKEISDTMLMARPTAVNLRWSIERIGRILEDNEGQSVAEIKNRIKKEADKILLEDIAINQKMGRHGQKLIPKGATIITHCNAGALATAGYGTALGVVRAAFEAGKKIKVIADETRPWLQGLRLTAFELMEDNIPVTVIADNAAGSLLRRGKIDVAVTGADRIASNGDVANKIGTYSLAVLAKENGVPFYVAAPLSTIDLKMKCGDSIEIEERNSEEITRVMGQLIGPENVSAYNPVFDITPAKYISGIITEKGVARPPYRTSLKKLFYA